MIDTGATSSLITRKAINRLGCSNQVYEQAGDIVLGDAKTKLRQRGWIYLPLNIHGFRCAIRVIVVDDLTTEFVLGLNFLIKFKVAIKMEEQCLVIHHRDEQIYVGFEKPDYVRLCQRYTIWPRSKCVVTATTSRISKATDVLLSVIDQKIQQNKRIRLCDGLVDVKDHSVQLTIYNPTTKVVTLPQSMLVGSISQLRRDESCSPLFSTNTSEENEFERTNLKETTLGTSIVDKLTDHLQQHKEYHKQVWTLLNQHKQLFDNSHSKTIKTTVHHVIDTGNHPPINAKPYFKTIDQRKKIQGEVDKMLKAGIIIPSSSPWSSPVVLLTKPNGEFRFIIDYRRLNAITKKDCYPQPTVEELIQRLGGHSWFTKLDLKSGYYQIAIQPHDKEKTAFITQDGLYQFEVLPMGLMNAPPIFQRVMNNIIGYKRWDYVIIYLDDILIFSRSFNDHMVHLQEVFNVLNEHQFTLNPNKCSVANQSIDFLSHTITKDAIVPAKDRIQAILDIPQPSTLAQPNRFIGKIGWYRKFIANFAQIAAPIHKVTNKIKTKRKEFYWGEDQIQAVNRLKQILTEEPLVLKYPHPTAPFILATDASEYAIGGTLKQVINGRTHFNYFLSRLLTTTEKNYPTIDREALAIFWCMEKLQQYLGGREVLIMSDHKPLEQFHKKIKLNNKRIEQWLIKHQDMIPQITAVKYRKGCNHGDADGMSRPEPTQHVLNVVTRSMARSTVNKSLNTNNDEIKLSIDDSKLVQSAMIFNFSLEKICREQDSDPRLMKLKRKLIIKNMSDPRYVIQDDVLYKVFQPRRFGIKNQVICIPLSMKKDVIQCYHDHPTGAHFGVNRTWHKLRQVCYWPNMKRDVEKYIRACEKCARFNIRRTKPPGHLHPNDYPQGPLEMVSMDFWGPTPQYSASGNKYVLVIMDYYTKYVVAAALPDNTAFTTAKFFVENFVFKYGIPRRLITDRGVHFTNELMGNLTKLLGTNHIQTAAYHPQGNGLIERFNATFHPQLAKLYNAELNNWDDYLSSVLYAYNTGVQSSTGYSPFQLMFGRHPILPLDHTSTTFRFDKPNDYWRKIMRCMKIYQNTASQQIRLQQQRTKHRFDQHRSNPKYAINDLVFWKIPGHRGKLQEQFSGPFIIIDKQHPLYTIQDTNSLSTKRVHVSDLKQIYPPYD